MCQQNTAYLEASGVQSQPQHARQWLGVDTKAAAESAHHGGVAHQRVQVKLQSQPQTAERETIKRAPGVA